MYHIQILRPCLFPGIHFQENHFPNFPVFVCHQKSWSTENTFRSTENTFRSTENTFWSTKTLFDQRKTLFDQRKTLSSQRKIQFDFQESVSFLAVFVFRKVVSGKPLSKLSCVCLPLEKLVNGKHFPVKGKFGLVFRKVFS